MREAMSATLSALPARFQEERAELLGLLRDGGILHRSETQPVLSRDGSSHRWMLDSLSVTLTPRGAELAGRCVLELLKRFDGRQLATYGLTAVPILQSCVLQSGGRYRGLLVRKERKGHGSLKLVEGPIDQSEPVVLVDDSVSSGLSLEEACARLEEAGLRVEGGVCLVRFGWHGGYAAMQERGYHCEAVYDIWDDFIYHMEGEYKPPLNPTKCFPEFEWGGERAPDGLHPSALARLAVSEFLKTGRLPRAPRRLDQEYDSSGGAWVSLRSRADVHVRHAREGFWHFPEEANGTAAEDLLLASLLTAKQLPQGDEGLELLSRSAVAVTFFRKLERCAPGQLDNERYGIVVRSLERPWQMGGALPRMPGIVGEWAQLRHARRKNAGLVSFEPYEIYRHELVKLVEPGADWQPTGVPAGARPWHKSREVCAPLAERARDLVVSQLTGQCETTLAFKDESRLEGLDSFYVTVYVRGRLRGCMGGRPTRGAAFDEDLRRLARAALEDARFDADASPVEVDDVAVSVSMLFDELVIGSCSPEEVVRYFRHGQQALMAYRDESVGLLLPFVASMQNLDAEGFAREVLKKAGLGEPPFYWCRFDCATWLADARGTHELVGGFPRAEACEPEELDALLARRAELHTQYLLRHQKPDGSFYTDYEPFQNRLYEGRDLPRLAHAAWTLARAARVFGGDESKAASERALEYLLRAASEGEGELWLEVTGQPPSVAELSFTLLALCESNALESDERRALCERAARTLWNCVSLPHGRVQTHREPSAATEEFQDYFPGQVLLALAASCAAGVSQVDEARLERAFLFYRHRFRHRRGFGQVSWYTQAFARWWHVTRDERFADFVFEIVDWLLTFQQERTGAFINDHQPETPGYTSAVYLEAVASAANLAHELGDERRRRSYADSYARGLRFLDRLVIQERDASVLPSPAYAFGGLRRAIHYSEIRTDFVQHALSAIMEYREEGMSSAAADELCRALSS
ncbi:MAG: AMMECR1 domain-containing protein [Acidobacteria bacterium]|nr:AMMECR1 domain-containing protein [Acidobacteriota bacterium]